MDITLEEIRLLHWAVVTNAILDRVEQGVDPVSSHYVGYLFGLMYWVLLEDPLRLDGYPVTVNRLKDYIPKLVGRYPKMDMQAFFRQGLAEARKRKTYDELIKRHYLITGTGSPWYGKHKH